MLLSALTIAAIAILIVAASGRTQPSLATTATPSAANTPVFQWGDTDCNGAIDTQDLMRVLSRAADLRSPPPATYRDRRARGRRYPPTAT